MPTTGVGWMIRVALSLYSDTLPDTTGVPRARHASDIPAIACASRQPVEPFSGFGKFRQFVIAAGRAPTHATFRAASNTAAAPPARGSSRQWRSAQSVLSATARVVPGIRTTAASPPGRTTVSAPTRWSYCSYTQRLLAIVGFPSSSSHAAARSSGSAIVARSRGTGGGAGVCGTS